MEFIRKVDVKYDLKIEEIAEDISYLSDTEIGHFIDNLATFSRHLCADIDKYNAMILEITKNLTSDGYKFINDLSAFLHDAGINDTTEHL